MSSSTLRQSAFACSLALLTVGFGLVQQVATAAPPPDGGAHLTTPNPYRATQIIGAKVSVQNNTAAGTVEDIVFSDSGDVEYLVVNNGGKLVSVPWTATTFNVAHKAAVVNITHEQYQAIPTFTTTTYPQFFTPTYRTETYKHYGLTPGQFRRIERRVP